MSRSGPLLSKDMPTGPEGRNSEVSESRRVRIKTQNNELTWEVERQELSLRLEQVTCCQLSRLLARSRKRARSLAIFRNLSHSLSRARAPARSLSERESARQRESKRESARCLMLAPRAGIMSAVLSLKA